MVSNAASTQARETGGMKQILGTSVLLLVIGLTGCASNLGEARREVSGELDAFETQVRAARITYSERMNRVSSEWICTGMSWPALLDLVNGDEQMLDVVMRACASRTFGVPRTD